ncbi:hypothetical protein BG015_005712 [Linnemannia schmuckeri]|uniref:Transferase n=1 Tax=Linnemannia schmuckeri TaxID=64567 RepID=A0A9P5VC87_9FUNG|nr:hypothetical protein BG015_005712 [Linnemannia schmuckeri]
MSPQRTLHEREKVAHHRPTEGASSSPSASRSPSFPASSRSTPQTRLRHRQLVQPITPTELEPAPDQAATITGGTTTGEAMRYPRVELSSLDLAKPRIYTRLLYFFEASQQQQQGSLGQPTITSTINDASLSAKGVIHSNNNNNNNNNISSSSSVSSSTFATTLSPPASPAGSSSSSSAHAKKFHSGSSSKSRLHYHYHSSPFMDPMLLQASLALVLSDFFPLAGRLCSNTSNNSNQSLDPTHAGATTTAAAAAGPPSMSSSTTTSTPATSSTPASSANNNKSNSRRPFIECNDRGVLFVVADTTTSMAQVRHGGFQDAILPPQLFPVGLYPASLRDPPLLGIQLTYTSDHSLIMGVAMDSSVLDATSWISFMEAWSKMTQGKDFGPYPILDRAFLEIHGDPYLASAVYRHQRINDSPPPPILFDNSLDNALDRGLGELEVTTTEDEDDDDEDDDAEEEEDVEDSSNLQRIQKMMESINEDSGKGTTSETTTADTTTNVPRVMIGDVEHLEGPIEGVSEQQQQRHQQQQQQSRVGGSRPRRRQESHSYAIDAAAGGQEPEGGNLHLFHFSPQQLDAIKKLASEQNIAAAACAADDKEISDKWVSTGDSLVAYLWKMTTITRRMEPDCKMMCGLVMDIRNRVAPPIPEGYIGNAILSIFVQMPVHSLLTTPLSLPSRLLRDELMLQSPEQLKSAISWIQRQENPHLIETTSNNPFGQDFMVWSFRKLNMYSPDFGQGPPVKVRIGRGGFGGGEGMCVIMDSGPALKGVNRGGGGSGVDVYLGLQGEHLRDFEMVHRGFMEGLLEPGGSGGGSRSGGIGSSSGDWEVI